MPTFTPPVTDGIARGDVDSNDPSERLFGFYSPIPTGITVWKDHEGNWQQGEYPYAGGANYTTFHNGENISSETDDGLSTAELVFQGGHVYQISSDVADELTAAGYGDRINIAEVYDRFSVNEPDPLESYTRYRVTHLDDNEYSFRRDGTKGVGVNVGSPTGTTTTNERDVFVRDGTDGWGDSDASAIFAPPVFGGGYNPQHGLAFRFNNEGGRNKFILVWHDVAFGSPTIINCGVFDVPDDGSDLNFRSQGFTSALGPLATNVFPYHLDCELRGNIMRVQVYAVGDDPPGFDHPNYAETFDLESFGDTEDIVTPDSGASGAFVAHVGTDGASPVTYPFIKYTRQD